MKQTNFHMNHPINANKNPVFTNKEKNQNQNKTYVLEFNLNDEKTRNQTLRFADV